MKTESEIDKMPVDAKVISLVKNEKLADEIKMEFARLFCPRFSTCIDSVNVLEKYYNSYGDSAKQKVNVFNEHFDSIYREIFSLLQDKMQEKMKVIEQEMAKGDMIIWGADKKPAYLTKQEVRTCIQYVLIGHFSLKLEYK